MKKNELVETNKFLKKLIYLISINILLILLFTPNSIVFAQDRVDVTFTTDAISFNAGDEIEVKVNVSGEGIYDVEGYIVFDETIMEYVSIEINETLTGWNGRVDISDPYYMEIYRSSGSIKAQNQYVAILKFKMKANVSNISIGLDDWSIVTSNASAIYQGSKDAIINEIEPSIISHNVRYNYTTNGGTPEDTTASVNEGSAIDLTAPATETKAGWTFVGWNTDATATTGLTSLNMGTSDITLYAIYNKEEELYLKTDKYKIGTENTSLYEEGDSYITRISPNTTLKAFLENCHSNGEISVLSKGAVIQSDELIGTGMTIKVSKEGSEEIVLTIVVIGDYNGNGKVDTGDLTQLRGNLYEDNSLANIYLKALDIDDSGKINTRDLTLMRGAIYENKILE